MEYILLHADTLTQTLGYFQTDCLDDTSKLSKVIAKIKDRYGHIYQLHIDRDYQQNSKRRYQAVLRETNIAPGQGLIVNTACPSTSVLLPLDITFIPWPWLRSATSYVTSSPSIGDLPKERPDVPTSPTYLYNML